MRDYNEKVDLATSFVRNNCDKEDEYLLRPIYNVTHLANNYFFYPFIRFRLDETKYSPLSQKELVKKFTSTEFGKMRKKDMESLFQETYNRRMIEGGAKPNHIVSLKNAIPNCMGYIQTYGNSIVINKEFIERYANIWHSFTRFNRENIGTSFLFTILHETQHNIQNDSIIDFLINEKQTEDQKASSAINLMYMSLESRAKDIKNHKFFQILQNDYQNLFYEHDANYNAMKKIYESVDIKNEVVAETISDFAKSSTYLSKSALYQDDKNATQKEIDSRANDMSDCVEYYLEMFESKIQDSPLKEKILSTIKDYIKKDKKGNSKFKSKISSDINEMVEIGRECRKVLYSEDLETSTK